MVHQILLNGCQELATFTPLFGDQKLRRSSARMVALFSTTKSVRTATVTRSGSGSKNWAAF